MSVNTFLRDGWGKNNFACVTERGQLITAPLDYSRPYTANATVNDQGYTVVLPKTAKRFVITDIILDADKSVSSTTAGTVNIYESADLDSAVVETAILTIEVLKNTHRPFIGLNLIVTQGKWVNFKTSDNNVSITILGYYVSA